MPRPEVTAEVLFQQGDAPCTPELSAVIPMYHERLRIELTLRDVLASLPARGPGSSEIVLVDDGSDDDTAGVCWAVIDDARATIDPSIRRVRLVTHLENQGKGAAVRTGLAHAEGRWRLIMDADNATAIDQLDKLMPHTAPPRSGEGRSEMVIGSRNTPDAEVEAQVWRQTTGVLFKSALSLLGIRLARDTQCGFKLYSPRASALIVEHAVENGYCFDIEHLLLVRAAGARFAEVGVRWEHVDGGQVSPILDGLRMLRAAYRIKRRVRSLGEIELPRVADPSGPSVLIEPKPGIPATEPAWNGAPR